MAKWKMKYADSLWLDVEPESGNSIDDIDPTWPGTWSGKYTVKTNLSDVTPIDSGALILFDGLNGRDNIPGKFRMSIDSAPSNTNLIPIGSYKLTIEIFNGLTTFRREVAQDTLTVSQEGIPV